MVTSHFPPSTGGLERHVSALTDAMASRGIEVDVIVPGTATAVHESEVHPGLTVRRFRSVVGGSHYPVAPGLWRYLRRNAGTYDLVHAHNYHALPALAAALSGARPLVITPHFHGTAHSPLGTAVYLPYRRAGRIIFDRASAVICVSSAEANLLASHFPRAAAKTRVIANGLDVEALRGAKPLPTANCVLLTAGRLERHKRVDLVLEALRLLPAEWHLCVIGKGRDRRRLERRAGGLSLSGRVSFIDHVGDELFRRWLKTAAVYVSLSSHEAFGLAVAEAAVAGAAVVVSDIPPHRELARLLGTGRFEFLRDDHGPALAQAIMRTERQPVDAAGLDQLSWERTAAETHKLYEAVVERACGHGQERSTWNPPGFRARSPIA